MVFHLQATTIWSAEVRCAHEHRFSLGPVRKTILVNVAVVGGKGFRLHCALCRLPTSGARQPLHTICARVTLITGKITRLCIVANTVWWTITVHDEANRSPGVHDHPRPPRVVLLRLLRLLLRRRLVQSCTLSLDFHGHCMNNEPKSSFHATKNEASVVQTQLLIMDATKVVVE